MRMVIYLDRTEGIEELKILNSMLKDLLDHPQPNMISYRLEVTGVLLDMVNYAGYGKVSERIRRGEI